MNVCVIGGSGFVGTNLISLIRGTTSRLVNLDKQPSKKYPELTRIVDVRDREALNEALKGQDLVILLAAEHRDDVSPVSDYYDVNVRGTENVLHAMDLNGVRNIIFTSSVAIYGLDKTDPTEEHPADPFNHYGKTKWAAEEKLREWFARDAGQRSLHIIRPTVIFGENNRGNVYNLLKQIASGRFLMIGKGENKKSMAYVGNIVSFIQFLMGRTAPGYQVFNYVDKPDFSIRELILVVEKAMGKKIPPVYIPRWIGIMGGYCFDLAAFVSRKKLPISSVRVKKFCATTQFNSDKVASSGFSAPFTLEDGLRNTLSHEFLQVHEGERVLFENE